MKSFLSHFALVKKTTEQNVTNHKLHNMRNLNGTIRMEMENGHEDLHGYDEPIFLK